MQDPGNAFLNLLLHSQVAPDLSDPVLGIDRAHPVSPVKFLRVFLKPCHIRRLTRRDHEDAAFFLQLIDVVAELIVVLCRMHHIVIKGRKVMVEPPLSLKLCL